MKYGVPFQGTSYILQFELTKSEYIGWTEGKRNTLIETLGHP